MSDTAATVVAGLSLQPVTLAMVQHLQAINSPFARADCKPSDFTLVPMIEGIYVMTSPTSEVGAALARGRAGLTEAALAKLGRKLTIEDCCVLGHAMQIQAASLTPASLIAASVAAGEKPARKRNRWKVGW